MQLIQSIQALDKDNVASLITSLREQLPKIPSDVKFFMPPITGTDGDCLIPFMLLRIFQELYSASRVRAIVFHEQLHILADVGVDMTVLDKRGQPNIMVIPQEVTPGPMTIFREECGNDIGRIGQASQWSVIRSIKACLAHYQAIPEEEIRRTAVLAYHASCYGFVKLLDLSAGCRPLTVILFSPYILYDKHPALGGSVMLTMHTRQNIFSDLFGYPSHINRLTSGLRARVIDYGIRTRVEKEIDRAIAAQTGHQPKHFSELTNQYGPVIYLIDLSLTALGRNRANLPEFTGLPLVDVGIWDNDLEGRLVAFKQSGKKIAFLSMSSVWFKNKEALYSQVINVISSISASVGKEYAFVLTSKDDLANFQDDNRPAMIIRERIRYSKILQFADIAVTSGGVTTSPRYVRQAVPALLVIPEKEINVQRHLAEGIKRTDFPLEYLDYQQIRNRGDLQNCLQSIMSAAAHEKAQSISVELNLPDAKTALRNVLVAFLKRIPA